MRSPWRDFASVLAREQCTTVLVQEYEYFRFDLLARLARRWGPVYATFQGGDLTLSLIERLVRTSSLRRCAGLIVASQRERDRLAERYRRPRSAIADIPNPLDTDLWRPEDRAAARQRLGISEQAFVVINHGRTDIYRKG